MSVIGGPDGHVRGPSLAAGITGYAQSSLPQMGMSVTGEPAVRMGMPASRAQQWA